ncbi:MULTISPECIES: hypothetical protein [unclassified Corallococcus]|uniref:hypothetical protein n=1 Tax=unclassified Corallococcus TaxID=2685029 RepID=UPI001A8E15AD|nr:MULTISPECIES: hypothetical protein [unclassified Corallococcus]MBN9685861.1 hypothetical protein [Corallococcus sp. NCSPR001]WAS82699.1 hypothetical protein O0N60_25630 [Corallococcus sp. NCRR]
MPCSNHSTEADADCVPCFVEHALRVNSIIAQWKKDELDEDAKKELQEHRKSLDSQYRALKLQGDNTDLCRIILRELNGHFRRLEASTIGDWKAITNWTITNEHLALYRSRIRKMGIWIGFTELNRLGLMFSVRFRIAIPSEKDWRYLTAGDPESTWEVNNTALQWDGTHYQVAKLSSGADPQITDHITTNPLGDCALESFLTLIGDPSEFARKPINALSNEKIDLVMKFMDVLNTRTDISEPVDATNTKYLDSIMKLRDLLARDMLDAEVSDAIIAEGVLPKNDDSDVSDKTAQTLKALGELSKAVFTSAGKNATEVQAICMDEYIVVTANKPSTLASISAKSSIKLLPDKDTNKQSFAESRTLLKEYGSCKFANTTAECINKMTGGKCVIILKEQEEAPTDLHAEQRLLLVLAERLKTNNVPKSVYIAGAKPPCATCGGVLRALKEEIKNLYALDFDYTKRKDEGGHIDHAINLKVEKAGSPYYTLTSRYQQAWQKIPKKQKAGSQ